MNVMFYVHFTWKVIISNFLANKKFISQKLTMYLKQGWINYRIYN